MQDVTEIFQYYRLCLRDIWNRCFFSDLGLRNYDSAEHFDRMVPLLFRALVLHRLEVTECLNMSAQEDTEQYLNLFRIVPTLTKMDVTILSARDANYVYPQNPIAGRSGSEEVIDAVSSELDLRFLNFFEWATLGYRDLKYYVARIDAFSSRPDLIGREAIVDVERAKIVYVRANTQVSS